MKKYLSGISSIVSGGLIFVLFALTNFVAKILGETKGTNMYEAIEFGTDEIKLTMLSIFAVVTMVVAGLLIVSGILSLLNNAKVLKIKKINNISIIISLVLLVAMILTTIFAFVFVAECNKLVNVLSVGFGVYLALAVTVVGFVLTLLTRKAK